MSNGTDDPTTPQEKTLKGVVVTLEDVSRTYQRGQELVHAVNHVSLSFMPAQLTLILGPSGGGKTTLLHLLGGMDRPSSGHIIAGTTDITQLSADRLAQWRRRHMGFVFQNFYLLPGYSALDNAALPLLLDGQPREQRHTRVATLLRQLGLGDRLGHTPAELSGGQIQRVAIARALAYDPPIIVADEPTGNLDSVSGHEIMAQLQALAHEDGRTVIVVSHNEEFIPMADRVIRMRDGHVESDSAPVPLATPTAPLQPVREKSRGPRWLSLMGESLRSLNRRRARAILTSLGVTIGVTSMVLLISIGVGLKSQVLRSIEGSQSMTSIMVSSQAIPSGITFSAPVNQGPSHPITPAALKSFARIPDVQAVYGTTNFLADLSTPKGSTTALVTALPPTAVTGGPRPALVAGILPNRRHPGLILPESTVAALFSLTPRTITHALDKTVRVALNGTMGTTGIKGTNTGLTESVVLRGIARNTLDPTDGVNAALGTAWLHQLTPHHRIVYDNAVVVANSIGHVQRIAHALQGKGYGVTTTELIIHQVQHSFSLVETGLGIVGGIALAVAGLMIGVVMSMAVLERRREIGVWRAVGARRRDVFVLFLVEAVLIGLAGGALGDLLGWGLGDLGAAVFHHPGLFVVPTWLVMVGLAFGGGVAAIAGAVPANHAARMRPVEALSSE